MLGFRRIRHPAKTDLPIKRRHKDQEGGKNDEANSFVEATDNTLMSRRRKYNKKLIDSNSLEDEQFGTRNGVEFDILKRNAINRKQDDKLFDTADGMEELSLLDARNQHTSDAAKLDAVRNLGIAHRYDLADRHERVHHEHGSPVKGILWAVLILHLFALAVWLRAWLRQRKVKDPVMKAHLVGPPQKQSCSYDLDKSFLPRIELPIKALNMKHSQA